MMRTLSTVLRPLSISQPSVSFGNIPNRLLHNYEVFSSLVSIKWPVRGGTGITSSDLNIEMLFFAYE